MKWRAMCEADTKKMAAKLAEYLKAGMVVLLEGQLGAGKTTFTKGLAEGLGIRSIIKSPTYTIIREYHGGKFSLYHIDLYRLNEESVEELYLDDYFNGEGISVVEWGSVAPDFLPEEFLRIEIKNLDENSREFTFSASGSEYEQVLMRFGQEIATD